jgi:hypothetical protein
MADTEAQKRRDRRIDLLYKNLEYVSDAYNSAEQVFPFWEAAFALIVGQLIVAYFNPGICIYQKRVLAIIGIIISAIWFILVSLNFQHALSLEREISELHNYLEIDFKSENALPRHFTFTAVFKIRAINIIK